jgi:hypothetical protein
MLLIYNKYERIKQEQMNLSSLKKFLETANHLSFQLPNGSLVPAHFHITEIGLLSKHFIDCGGTVREEKVATLQLWTADDVEHRLSPTKLHSIITMYEKKISQDDLELEVEYQSETISKYGLAINGDQLQLLPTQTNCLAQDQCGIPTEKIKMNLSELGTARASCCTPGGGCC